MICFVDEEKETVPEKKDKKKSAALWKPNGPSSPTTVFIITLSNRKLNSFFKAKPYED